MKILHNQSNWCALSSGWHVLTYIIARQQPDVDSKRKNPDYEFAQLWAVKSQSKPTACDSFA